jgi:hypothetical protein
MRLLQKSEKGPFCHSELVEELWQIKQLEHPSTSFDILRQAQDDIVMVSLSNHQGDKLGLLQEAQTYKILLRCHCEQPNGAWQSNSPKIIEPIKQIKRP